MNTILFLFFVFMRSLFISVLVCISNSYTLSAMDPLACSTPSCLEVKASPVHGFGVFATDKIATHVTLGSYTGDRLSQSQLEKLYPGDTLATYVIQSANDPDYIIDACSPIRSGWTRYINSGTSPNVVFKDIYKNGRTNRNAPHKDIVVHSPPPPHPFFFLFDKSYRRASLF